MDSALGTPGIPALAVKAVVLVAVLVLAIVIGSVTEQRPENAPIENSVNRVQRVIEQGTGAIVTGGVASEDSDKSALCDTAGQNCSRPNSRTGD